MSEAIKELRQTLEERYRRCAFNNIQHIDIYGKCKSIYQEHRLKVDPPLVTCISNCSPMFFKCPDPEVKQRLESKLKNLSITTKVCGLYPGNDILSKKSKFRKLSKSNFTFCALK